MIGVTSPVTANAASDGAASAVAKFPADTTGALYIWPAGSGAIVALASRAAKATPARRKLTAVETIVFFMT
jgi:hypothetical protein